jgi:hypothetical protein
MGAPIHTLDELMAQDKLATNPCLVLRGLL